MSRMIVKPMLVWFALKHLMTIGFNATCAKDAHMKHVPILQMQNTIIVKVACNLIAWQLNLFLAITS